MKIIIIKIVIIMIIIIIIIIIRATQPITSNVTTMYYICIPIRFPNRLYLISG